MYIQFPPAFEKDFYPWRVFHSDQVRIPLPSASKKSKSSFVGHAKGRSLQYISYSIEKVSINKFLKTRSLEVRY